MCLSGRSRGPCGGDYQKLQTGDDEALGKRVADGTLIAFGSYSVLNHQEGLPTHGP